MYALCDPNEAFCWLKHLQRNLFKQHKCIYLNRGKRQLGLVENILTMNPVRHDASEKSRQNAINIDQLCLNFLQTIVNNLVSLNSPANSSSVTVAVFRQGGPSSTFTTATAINATKPQHTTNISSRAHY